MTFPLTPVRRGPRLLRSLAAPACAAVLCALPLAGCRGKPNPDSFPATVQIINAVPDSGSISAREDGKDAFGKVGYGDTSGLYGIDPGHYRLRLTENPPYVQPVIMPVTSIDVDAGNRYTALAYGVALGPSQVAVFSTTKPSAVQHRVAQQDSTSSVRVFDAATGIDKIDVLVNSIVAFKNIGFGERSDPIPLAGVPDEWSVKPAGDSDDLYGTPTTLQLKSGHKYLVVIMGSVDSNDLRIKAFPE